jgi:ElaB/YqjD/DUF883 family membrane-anchored ribosome-binding protein
MDVRLPDGTIIKNVPDGTSKADLVAKLQRNGMAVPSEWLAATPTPKPQIPQADPSEGGSTIQVYNPFGKNLDTGLKVGQATTRVLAGIGSGLDDLKTGVGQRLGFIDQASVDEKKRRDAPLKATTAGTVGNVIGKVAVGLPAAFVPGANTLVGAGLIGGAQGVLEPTASDESVAKNALIGASAGAGGVVLGRVLRAGYQGVKGLIEPFTEAGQNRIAGRVLERFAENPDAVRNATSAATETGARPLLAEAARDRGVATLQRALESDPQIAAMVAQRAADNNAARVATIGSIAGDPAKRAAAEAARKAASGDMYQAATNATYTVDSKLGDLLNRPAVKQALQRAKSLAENQGRPFTFATETQAPFSGVGGRAAESSKQITGQGLQDLKMALDEMLSDPASGFTGKAGDTIKNLRGQIMDWMEQANPAFKQARTAYASASKPINAMDVGQRLLDKTTGAIRDLGGNQRLQANAFARALNDEAGTVQKATGFKGVNALADVLQPEQLSKLNAVRNELELASNLAQAANGPGSQTAKSLASQNLLRQILGPTGLPQSWAESTMLETLLRPVQFGMKAAEPRIQNKLAEIMLDPSKAGNALSAAQKKELSNALQRVAPYLQQAGQQSIPASTVLVSGKR